MSSATWVRTVKFLRTRVVGLVLALLAGLALQATPASAATTAWTQTQTFAKSSAVHAPTFISPTRGWALVGSRLLQTNDAGQRWSVSVPAEWTSVAPRALTFADPMHGWVACDGFVMATIDGGAHWKVQAADKTAGHDWVAVHAADASHAFAVSDDGFLLGTEDAGATWSVRASEPGCSLRAIEFADSRDGWAVGSDTDGHALALATTDGGATWGEAWGLAPVALSAIDFADALHGMAAGAGAIVRTADGGRTWTPVSWPLAADETPTELSLAFSSATHGWVAVSVGGAGRLYETLDSGVTWRLCELPCSATGISGMAALDELHALAFGACLPSSEVLTAGSIWSLPAASAGAYTGSSATAAPSKRAVTAKAYKKAAAKRHVRKHRR